MRRRAVVWSMPAIGVLLLAGLAGNAGWTTDLTPKQELGKRLFFDEGLSRPATQSCATCHSPQSGFADPRTDAPTSQGAVSIRYGNRNTPSAAYAAYSPALHYDPTPRPGVMEGMYVGGLFWDGRVDTLEEQAHAPFLNPLEMHNANDRAMAAQVLTPSYRQQFQQVFGPGALRSMLVIVEEITEAIADYERSSEVCQFTSKYDAYLDGEARLTDQEASGLALFSGPAKCMNCHSVTADPAAGKPLFTNFGHQNTGVPANPDNPFYQMPPQLNPDGTQYVDLGLGALLNDPMQDGKFRIPSLRNCAVTPPYMHNGVFATLYDVVHFNNTRDVLAWPPPEVPRNVHRHMPPMPGTFGQLGLTEQQELDVVAFLETLTDGYVPPA